MKVKRITSVLTCMLIIIEIFTVFLTFNTYSNKSFNDIRDVSNTKRKQFSMYVENDNGNYDEYNSSELFPIGYNINLEKSICVDIDGNEIKNILSGSGNEVIVTSNKPVFCYVYFDKDDSVYGKVVSDYINNNGVNKLSDSDKENRDYDTYYYTGDVTNNNVMYAGYCWKMVITTEGNGVKMIYNGESTNGSCNSNGYDTTIGSSKFNSSANSPAYVGYMYNKVYTSSSKSMSSDTTEYVYGNTFKYSNGTYTLSNTITSSSWSSIYETGLNNYHYTCFNTSGTCTSLYYIYYTYSGYAHYITLTGGKSVEDALNEMLHPDEHTTDSTIKTKIDNWYEENLLNVQDSDGNKYSSYLQNTIYCNNREATNLGGWNPKGGSTNTDIYFNYNTLDCENKSDQFTLSVDNGGTEGYGNNALKYPIGLLSYKEVYLAINDSRYNYLNEKFYWLLSPSTFEFAKCWIMSIDGLFFYDVRKEISDYDVHADISIRPALTLSSNVEITNGDGSNNSPYQVKLSNK